MHSIFNLPMTNSAISKLLELSNDMNAHKSLTWESFPSLPSCILYDKNMASVSESVFCSKSPQRGR